MTEIATRTIDIDIPYKFTCRPYQKSLFAAMKTVKRAVLVWHRRAGKEKTCWNFMIMQALRKKGTYFYFFPTFSQGRKVLWEFIDKQGFRVLDHIPKELIDGQPNSSEMKIRLKNGSLVQIVGLNNFDSIVGTNPVGCVFSEYSLQDPVGWTLMRPILAENDGWAIFNGTPRGSNHFKDLYDMAKGNPNWFTQRLTVDDTRDEYGRPIISDVAIEDERAAGMSEDFIQQEFYVDWCLGIEGSYYARYVEEARDEGRIGNVVWDRHQKVFTAWDIGYGDATSIVMYQIVGSEIHIIDYYENQGESIAHYIGELHKKPYIYGDHFGPHDLENHSISSGFSCKQVAADLGVSFIVLPTLRTRVEDGIEAVRGIFPRVWLDEKKCERLIKCLQNYRKEFDSIHNVYKSRPRHDEWSHGCFVAGTQIRVAEGLKSIEEIEVGDLVETPNGFKKVLNRFMYRSDDLYTVTCGESEFTCTGNHKVFTDKGLIYADALRYNDLVFSYGDKDLCRKKFGLSSKNKNLGFRESFLSAETNPRSFFMDISSVGKETTIEEQSQSDCLAPTCKEPFGLCIKARFLQGIISTTKTETDETTALKILSSSPLQNIPSCTLEPQNEEPKVESQLNTQCPLLSNGMLVQKEKSGTENMLSTVGLEKETNFQKYANGAELITSDQSITKDFAPMHVNQPEELLQKSITKQEGARCVQRNLAVTNTLERNFVLSCVKIKISQKVVVYDFEVEDDHCYYANDILVSNSDSFRYMALAIKRFVDSSKGITDDEAERLMDKHRPRFDN